MRGVRGGVAGNALTGRGRRFGGDLGVRRALRATPLPVPDFLRLRDVPPFAVCGAAAFRPPPYCGVM